MIRVIKWFLILTLGVPVGLALAGVLVAIVGEALM